MSLLALGLAHQWNKAGMSWSLLYFAFALGTTPSSVIRGPCNACLAL